MTLRTGIIGFGTSGRIFHAPFVDADPAYSPEAVVTRDETRRAEVEARYPAARVVSTADDLLGLDLDLVVIGTPPATHAELAHTFLDAGVAVVVDKPFVVTSEEGRALVEKAARTEVPLTVFQNRRWDGDFLTVRELLSEGALGDVWRFESRFERWRLSRPASWKTSTKSTDGGGILYDLGTHLIDQAVYLFGAAEPVYAEVVRRGPHAAADDDAFVVLAHESGVRSQLWMSGVAAQSGPRFRVLGSSAGYTKYGLDPQEDALKSGASPADPEFGHEPESAWGTLGIDGGTRLLPTKPGNYAGFYAQLAKALTAGDPLPVDPADAVRVIALIERIHQEFG
ncbi:Gfo/Idh/MocA family oxidoreductase [Amycolatopsis sp. GM8]|uniref:Gfo/Idh/MocA family protein n=1 Tax=Amycolatopsis sp. GM8 TaxID=2896530 RepID=UPI001F36232A|nr:Gfo/Idh/MocA family oxidoreductase [Amycolatopsis sp. GM8]